MVRKIAFIFNLFASAAAMRSEGDKITLEEQITPEKPMRSNLSSFIAELALLEESTETTQCDKTNTWTLHERIAKGGNGEIIRVTRSNDRMSYALKRSLDGSSTSKSDIRAESKIMARASCSNVMPVIDKYPCEVTRRGMVSPMPSTYVSIMMNKDLQAWVREAPQRRKDRCRDDILSQLLAGLRCLHRAGYVHGDFKLDNVLIEGYADNNCPTNLRIIDFGLSNEIDSFMETYMKKWLSISTHLVESMFDGGRDPLKQRSGHEVYMDSYIDLCSLASMMKATFNKALNLDMAEPIQCGQMGYGRRNTITIY